MKEWDENLEQVSKITPDKEKAKSLIKLVKLREKDIKLKKKEFATLIVEGYYEIIKEIITAIMSIDGYKTTSHELLVGYISKFYKKFSTSEVYLIDQLRRMRNDIAYRGVAVNEDYIHRNKERISKVISKLKNEVFLKLED
tara:strand:- start:406 stop:828 length:423 start_codon:yes stop_codon:yes gene_type:complete